MNDKPRSLAENTPTRCGLFLPFEVKIPNEETFVAMEDARLERNLEEWASVDAFLGPFFQPGTLS